MENFEYYPKEDYTSPCIHSATITFKDGKVLVYSSADKGRSLCNPESYHKEMVTDACYGATKYTFTLTDEDYALAKMPNEE